MAPATETDLEEGITEDAPDLTSGERLKAAREERGLSLKDIAAKTHQSLDVLNALETMQTDHISPTILRMQANNYAQFLGLPGAEIARGYCATNAELDSNNMPAEIMRANMQENRRRLWPIAVGAAVVVVCGVAFWSIQSVLTAPRQAPVVAVNTIVPPVTTVRAERPSLSVVKPELSIRALTSAWIEVRGSDGTIFRNRQMRAGEVYYPRMDAAWTVTVRNGAAFEWWLGDHRIGPLSEEAAPAYSLNVDEATLRGLEQLSPALAKTDSRGGQRR